MKTKNIILSSAILLAGVCASQADYGFEDSYQESNSFETGFYAGGSLGSSYSSASSKHSFAPKGGSVVSLANGNPKSGYAGDIGIHAGYLYPVDDTNWVVGLHLFTDVNLGTKSKFETKVLTTPAFGTVWMPWTVGAGLRAGYIFNETWMLYATSGIVATQMKYSIAKTDGVVGRDDKVLTGFFYGAGVEKQLSNGHRVGLELTHRIYGKKTFSVKDDGYTFSSTIKPKTLGLKLSYTVPF